MDNQPTINDLHADPKNPRRISKDQFDKLRATMDKFGDLGGIVRNLQTDQLVGGHMRVERFKADQNAKVQITQRFDTPTAQGTVALGYVIVNGEPWNYREVRWPLELQRAANIAANYAGGEFDNELLAENLYALSELENSDELLALTAMDDEAIGRLIKTVAGTDEPAAEATENERLSFRLTAGQREIVEQAIAHVLQSQSFDFNLNPDKNGNALYFLCTQYLSHEDQNLPPVA